MSFLRLALPGLFVPRKKEFDGFKSACPPGDPENARLIRSMVRYMRRGLDDPTDFNTIADLERYRDTLSAKIEYLKVHTKPLP